MQRSTSRPRPTRAVWILLALAAAGAPGCDVDAEPPPQDPAAAWVLDLPPGFPRPAGPADDPLTVGKVTLGRRLFYDPRLSANGTQSCATCHVQARAFTEPRAVSVGSTGEAHRRNAMSLANAGYVARLNWADPDLDALEEQALIPLFGDAPVELGNPPDAEALVARLAADPDYVRAFADAFPDDPAIGVATITRALAAFQRALVSADSPYDRYTYRDDGAAMSADAVAGLALFRSERLSCARCHADFTFSGATTHEDDAFVSVAFHNNGLYDVDGAGAYPARDQGLFDVTGVPRDRGRFKPPTLRNVALTAPYMHDGSIATLEAVIDHYAAGGRLVTSGPDAGDGRATPNKSELVRGFTLSADERRQLLAFLHALTDEGFVTDPRFADPR